MKNLILALVLISCSAAAQNLGPQNVGREYGNPKMPWVVSHLAGANKERLKRANSNSRHSIFGKILCFRKLCRVQSGHSASLKDLSRKKFERRVERNARKGLYHNTQPKRDSTVTRKTPPPKVTPPPVEVPPATPVFKPDSLIVLGAEVLFETNKSTLKSEHFEMLNSIVRYLILHPDRHVKISGHTDNIGTEGHNINLSRRRADVVAQYLVSQGVDKARVKTSGLGSAKPIAENTTNDGRKKNRRVELLIYSRK
jgi:outer membrane protein OmpA-like peptidoglycan-associated protein